MHVLVFMYGDQCYVIGAWDYEMLWQRNRNHIYSTVSFTVPLRSLPVDHINIIIISSIPILSKQIRII